MINHEQSSALLPTLPGEPFCSVFSQKRIASLPLCMQSHRGQRHSTVATTQPCRKIGATPAVLWLGLSYAILAAASPGHLAVLAED